MATAGEDAAGDGGDASTCCAIVVLGILALRQGAAAKAVLAVTTCGTVDWTLGEEVSSTRVDLGLRLRPLDAKPDCTPAAIGWPRSKTCWMSLMTMGRSMLPPSLDATAAGVGGVRTGGGGGGTMDDTTAAPSGVLVFAPLAGTTALITPVTRADAPPGTGADREGGDGVEVLLETCRTAGTPGAEAGRLP